MTWIYIMLGLGAIGFLIAWAFIHGATRNDPFDD